jgi:hypothetical protein
MREPAGPLRHVGGFPARGLLRVLRPTPRPSVDDAPTRLNPHGMRAQDGDHGVVPTFTTNRSTGEVPSYAPAASPRLRRSLHHGLPAGDIETDPGVPHPVMTGRVRAATQPESTGLELVEIILRGVTTLVPRVHLPVPLAGPTPSGSAGASRRCRGCFPPIPVVSPGQAAPSFTALLRQHSGAGLSPPLGYVAPRGAPCRRSRSSSARR